MLYVQRQAFRLLPLLASLVSLAACSDPAAPTRLSASVSPVHQWAGGLIELEIGDGRAEEVSEVLADGNPVVVDRIVGNTLLTRLPETANGPVSIKVDFGESTVDAGFVEAYGVAGVRDFPEHIQDRLREYPAEPGVSIVFQTCEWPPCTAPVAWIHLSGGIHRSFVVDHNSVCETIGVIPEVPALITCPAQAWQIRGGRLHSLGPSDVPAGGVWFGSLSSELWLELYRHVGHVWRRVAEPEGEPDWVRVTEITAEDSREVVFLRSANRAYVRECCFGGPVLDTQSGLFVYGIGTSGEEPRVGRYEWAIAAGEAGGVFYLSGDFREGSFEKAGSQLAIMDGANGKILLTRDLVIEDRPHELAHDPERHVVLGLSVGNLLVFDATTLEERGRIAIEEYHPDTIGNQKVLVDTHYDRAYLVMQTSSDTRVVEFRLPPVE